jgi:ribosomal-protein-alanine N-acetyltransferase
VLNPLRIETERLLLRKPVPEDAEAIFSRYASDIDATWYMSWPRHESITQTREFLQFSDAEWERWPAGPYVIESRAGRHLLGGTGLAFQSPETAVTGYILARDAWGFGYATEALGAIVVLAPQLRLTRVEAFCHPANHASLRVLEKCGFQFEERRKGVFEFPNASPHDPQEYLCWARAVD